MGASIKLAEEPKAARRSSKTETIARLLSAARREFAVCGLAGANMESIARSAGVTKQLLYQYYESKHDLFSAVLDQLSGEVVPSLLSFDFDQLEPEEALLAFADHAFDQYRTDPLLGRLAAESFRFHDRHPSPHNHFVALMPALVEKLDSILRRGMETGGFRPGLDTRSCLAMISLLMTGGFTNRYSVSSILDRDSAAPDGMDAWRQAARQFVVQAVSR